MKKIYTILLIFIFTLNVNAKEVTITCPDKARIETNISCNININYNSLYGGLESNIYFTEGLTVNNFNTSSKFSSGLLSNNKLSLISDEDMINNNTAGTINLYINKEARDTETITLSNIIIIDSNFNLVDVPSTSTTITIDKTEVVENTPPKEETKPVYTPPKPNVTYQEPVQEEKYSSLIQSLTIDNINIDFNKEIYEYNIDIESNIDKLNINITLEDTKSTYVINGNDNLIIGNNTITIEVISQDNNKSIYTINANKKSLDNDSLLKELNIKNYKINFEKNKFKYYLIIKNENKLEIEAIPNSDKSKVVIGGNDNLKTGSDINIIVESEQGSTSMYTITILKQDYLKNLYILIGITIFSIIALIIIKILRRKNSKEE